MDPQSLRSRIQELESELATLRDQLASAEAKPTSQWKWPLQKEEYERYSRQLVVPGIGVEGQLALKSSSVLIVGAGGLGCPAAAYLAGAGVGRIGIVDGDVVEVSNLHRQIGHSTGTVGALKVHSLGAYLASVNPLVKYEPHGFFLTAENAVRVVSGYNIVLDCTDRPATRYLVSDAAVACGKPVLSAAALRTEGQLLVLNWPAGVGPCYRCVFPRPPPADTVVGCGEGGVLGPTVGLMGVLQAHEALGILLNWRLRGAPEMQMFSPRQGSYMKSIKMRGRQAGCLACSAPRRKLELGYEAFCGAIKSDEGLGEAEEDGDDEKEDEEKEEAGEEEAAKGVSAREYARVRADGVDHVLLDVRDPAHFAVVSLPGAINVATSKIMQSSGKWEGGGHEEPVAGLRDHVPVYVICRLGNDSRTVTRMLVSRAGGRRVIRDVRGGLRAWKDEVDESLPFV